MSHFSEIDAHVQEQIDAIAAQRDAAISRGDANEHAAECAFRKLEESEARCRELEQRLDACERAKRVYFLEAESNRKLLEQQQKYQCEGYIWEPA